MQNCSSSNHSCEKIIKQVCYCAPHFVIYVTALFLIKQIPNRFIPWPLCVVEPPRHCSIDRFLFPPTSQHLCTFVWHSPARTHPLTPPYRIKPPLAVVVAAASIDITTNSFSQDACCFCTQGYEGKQNSVTSFRAS